MGRGGDLLIVSTSNGRNEAHTRVPSPRAPSLIAVDKRTGQVAWRAIGAGANVLHGQWSSPTAATVNGRTQILFGGGDGYLRAYDPASGRELWRFDGNPKDAPWRPRDRGTKAHRMKPLDDGERHGDVPYGSGRRGVGPVTPSSAWARRCHALRYDGRTTSPVKLATPSPRAGRRT